MRLDNGGVKLKRGTASRIAGRMKLSCHHVNEFAKGQRTGSDKLYRAVMQEYVKQQTASTKTAA